MKVLRYNFLDKKFQKFILVGVLNTLIGYSLFAIFLYMGLVYPLAVFLATVLGVIFNFKTIGFLVFGHQGYSKLRHFILVYVFLYFLNVFGLWFFEQIGLDNKYISSAILLAPLALISFVLNKKYVFK